MCLLSQRLKHELQEKFAALYWAKTRYYYPAHAELDAEECFGGKYAENIKLLRIFYEKRLIVLKKRIIKNNYFENFVEFIAFYIFMM